MKESPIGRALAAVVVAGCFTAGCGVDQEKFTAARRAGIALEVEAKATGFTGRSSELQRQFETEVATLDGRAKGDAEERALRAYKESSEAYMLLIRFRSLDFDAPEGRIVLVGTNLEAASRYQLPVQTTNGVQWVDSSAAMETFWEVAKAKLAEANAIVDGS